MGRPGWDRHTGSPVCSEGKQRLHTSLEVQLIRDRDTGPPLNTKPDWGPWRHTSELPSSGLHRLSLQSHVCGQAAAHCTAGHWALCQRPGARGEGSGNNAARTALLTTSSQAPSRREKGLARPQAPSHHRCHVHGNQSENPYVNFLKSQSRKHFSFTFLLPRATRVPGARHTRPPVPFTAPGSSPADPGAPIRPSSVNSHNLTGEGLGLPPEARTVGNQEAAGQPDEGLSGKCPRVSQAEASRLPPRRPYTGRCAHCPSRP